jgi:GNAT superfamily N-acetyltransferase
MSKQRINEQVILAGQGGAEDEVRIEVYTGFRDELRHLFALAEDSAAQLDSYLWDGRILVARYGDDILAHLQLVDTDRPDVVEIKNMAVLAAQQGRGIGARLVHAALDLASTESRATVIVATATADTGNLRFYQRQGFRFRSVERDAFTPATGYPTGTSVDGVPLRDRIWLDRPVESTPTPPRASPASG